MFARWWQVSIQYPSHAKGTGVLLDYKGHSCIVAGALLVPSPVAASSASAHFVLPGIPCPVKVSLRPGVLFEALGRDASMVIAACDRPIVPPLPIPPAIPAPAEYTETVMRFWRCGRLQSPTAGVGTSTATTAGGVHWTHRTEATESCASGSGVLTAASEKCQRRRRHRNTHSRTDFSAKHGGGLADKRVRRGGVFPGAKAYRRPNDPNPVEPFAISVEQGGVVLMEMVAHAHGRNKRAHRLAVQSDVVALGVVTATEPAATTEAARVERDRSRNEAGAGRRTLARAGESVAGDLGKREARNAASDGGSIGGKGEGPAAYNERAAIGVVVSEQEMSDGVHGAPVFMGGQLFGFAVQERVGEYVKEVLPASTLGFLPTSPHDMAQRTLATNDRPRLLAKQTNLNSGPIAPAPNPITVTGRPLGEGNGGTAEDEMEERVEGGKEV
ncbi:unnamed protein product, partial [Ectocarpus sp. 12 AP-2014]